MNLHIFSTREQAEANCAQLIANQISIKANSNLGLATGGTPVGVYTRLIDLFHNRKLTMREVTSFNLDEYLGLEQGHHQTYRSFMEDKLFNHLDIKLYNTFFPQNKVNYDKLIELHGGIDLQLLGLGSNGHIAFNEPGSSFESETRIVELTAKTMQDNSRFFKEGEFQPNTAVSMGIKSILRAKEIVLLVTGESKSEALNQLMNGETNSSFPASALNRHPNVTIIADNAAAKNLKHEGQHMALA